MTDHLTPERRSWNMGRIRNKNTKPEIVVRSILHGLGYRFTVNGPKNRKLPGKPDIVLPKYKTVIFVHGCFWHRHKGCKETTTPKTRTAWWQAKFDGNVERDRRNQREFALLIGVDGKMSRNFAIKVFSEIRNRVRVGLSLGSYSRVSN